MASEIASAYVSIFPRFKDLGKSLQSEFNSVDTDGHGRRAGQGFVGGFGGGIGKLGAVIAGAFAGVQIGSFFKDAIQGASNLNELVAQSDQVFGDSAKEVVQWSKTSSKAFGQSQRGALTAANDLGFMFKQMGIGVPQARDLSKQMVELASDFGSFKDADPTEVLNAMQAAFRGEYDALQRFVPLIDQATVETKALEMGLAGSTKELTQQDKALAVHAIIMGGADVAQGDFLRTADSFANVQRVLNAEWSNAKDTLGQIFLPMAKSVAQWMINSGIPAFLGAAQAIAEFAAGFSTGAASIDNSGIPSKMSEIGAAARTLYDEWAPRIKEVFDRAVELAVKLYEHRDAIMVVLPSLATFVGLLQAWAAATKVIAAFNAAKAGAGLVATFAPMLAAAGVAGILIAVLAAVAVAAVIAYQKFEPFREVVDKVAAAVRDGAVAAFNWLRETWTSLWPTMVAAFNTAKDAIGTAAAAVGRFLTGVASTASTVAGQVKGFFTGIVSSAVSLYNGIVTALTPLAAWFNTHVVSTFRAGWDMIWAFVQLIVTTLLPIFSLIATAVSIAFDIFKAVIGIAVAFATENFNTLWTIISTVFQLILIIVTTSVGYFLAVIGTFIGILGPIWSGFWNQVWTILEMTFGIMKATVETVLGVIRGIFQMITGIISGDWGQFWEGLKTVVSSLFNGAKEIISTVWEAIKSTFTNTLSTIQSTVTNTFNEVVTFISGIPGRVTGALGDMGRLLYNAGKDIIQGLINGLKDKLGEVDNLVGSIAGKIASLKGPPAYDKVLLIPHGQWIMQGLMKGISSQFPALEAQLTGLTANIPQLAVAGVGRPSAVRLHAGWEPGVVGTAGGGITNIVNVDNPFPRGEDIGDALGWASRRMAR